MISSEKTKNYVLQYIIYTYGLFVLLIVVLGGIATVVFHGEPLIMKWLISITAWTPTYVFLLMFKKLYPNSTIKKFYKNAFSRNINIRLLVTTTLIQILIFVLGVYMESIKKGVPAFSLLDFSSQTITSALFFTLWQA